MSRRERPGVGLFVKPPEAGKVKTRLTPPLEASTAATLYRAFVADTAATLDGGRTWDWGVFSTDVTAQQRAWESGGPKPGWWSAQFGADLGERMHRALGRMLEEGRPSALLVGSDHPTLPRVYLEQAVTALTQADVVLGPSVDGGYYLVGVTRPQAALFRELTWSTPAVLNETLQRVAAEGLKLALLPPWYDVDTPADLAFLRTHLHALALAGTPRAPRTSALLEEIFPTRRSET